jgi:soluble lytic murein transglycosylase-like protein
VTLAFAIALVPLSSPAETTTGTNTTYAHAMRSINPRLRDAQSRAYAEALLSNSQRMHLDPRLVMAVVTAESSWNVYAVSPDGAEGLGQFKPETARELGVSTFSGRSNLRGVTIYLHQLLGMFKSSRNAMRLAIASYNAGPYAIRANGGAPRGETQRYVTRVMALWHDFKKRLSPQPAVAEVAEILTTPQAVMQDENAYWGDPPLSR